MTPEELQEIRERANKATPGRWIVADGGEDTQDTIFVFDEPSVCDFYNSTTDICDGLISVDSEFIAHAREDVPKLLDEVERLRGALEEIRDNVCGSEMYETAQEIAEQALEETGKENAEPDH